MPKKLTYKDIKRQIEDTNYILLSDVYINNHTPLKLICNNGHNCNIRFKDFKRGIRCRVCFNKQTKIRQTLDYEFIKNEIDKYDYTLLSKDYINNSKILKLRCNNNHICYISYANFQQGTRCKYCYLVNNRGEDHPRWNPEKELLDKLRIKRTKKWIIQNMKQDPNYNLFIKSNKNYHLDHIFPIKAFSDFLLKHDLTKNETLLRFLRNNIINEIENLQLIPEKHNLHKSYKYNNDMFEEKYKHIILENK